MFNENSFLPDENIQPEEDKNIERNRKFYVAKKTTPKFPELSSPELINIQKKNYSMSREMPDKYKNKDLKTPEFEKEIDKAKKMIIEICKELGFSEEEINDRFVENDDIHLFPKKIFNKIAKGKLSGQNSMNEIFVNESTTSGTSNEDCSNLIVLHELIHSIAINKVFLSKGFIENQKFSSGYKSNRNEKLKAFNEGLTETTAQQILLENEISSPGIAYVDEVIFISELAKDVANKEKVSPKEILAHFQKGMIKGERKYLKIIIKYYGQEAFNSLVNMECRTEDIIRISKIFNLPNVERKIINFRNNKIETTIDIGNNVLNIKSIKPEKKESVIKNLIRKFSDNF